MLAASLPALRLLLLLASSTASVGWQCFPPDRQLPTAVFPAGAQPPASDGIVHRRTSTTTHNHKHTTNDKDTIANTQPQRHTHSTQRQRTTTARSHNTQPQRHNHSTQPQTQNRKHRTAKTTTKTQSQTSQTHSHKDISATHNHNTQPQKHTHSTQPQHTTTTTQPLTQLFRKTQSQTHDHNGTSTTHNHNAQPQHTHPQHTTQTHNHKHNCIKDTITNTQPHHKDTSTTHNHNTQPQRHIHSHSTQPQCTTTAHNYNHITANTDTQPLTHTITNISDNMASRSLEHIPGRLSQYMSMQENVSVLCPAHLFFLCLCWTRHLTGGTPLSCKNVSHSTSDKQHVAERIPK